MKAYKKNPNAADKIRLDTRSDEIFTQSTASATLNLALKRIYNNKSELLLVLEHPDIPLHNNGAENAIREHVKKRKISGGTRSETGRRCRDTFTSLKKCAVNWVSRFGAISKIESKISGGFPTCRT